MKQKGMGLVEMVVAMLILAIIGLGVTATIGMLSGKGLRRAGGSSLDLQALSYARQTLDQLRDAVSTDTSRSTPLAITGTSVNVTSTMPVDFRSSPINGTRTYLVSAVSGTDLKKVTVAVSWTDS